LYIPELQNIDHAVQDFMKKWDIPGGSVAITKDEKLIYARGFGLASLESNISVTPNHQFRIASLSKSITAIAIMQQVQSGHLGLNSLVFGENGILSDSIYLSIRDPRIKKITVRHLLQHRAGWDRHLSGDPMCDPGKVAKAMGVPPPADAVTIIRYMLNQPLDFHPGSRFAYSNLGYNILGRVIEKITGHSYQDYVNTYIFHPLGITHTVLGKNLLLDQFPQEVNYYESRNNKPVASVYDCTKKVTYPYGGFNLEAMDAHGGWISTPTDLLRLITAIDGFESRPDLLSPASISTMTESPDNDMPRYALGWCVNSSHNWWHTGSLPGTSALMARTHDGYTWSVLFNRRSEDPNYFGELDRLMWKGMMDVTTWPSHDLFEKSVETVSETTSVHLLTPVSPHKQPVDPNQSFSLSLSESNPKVYPNPSIGVFNLEFTDRNIRQVGIVISNQLGQVVKTLNLDNSSITLKYPLSMDNYPDGVYWMQINTSAGSTQRIIVKQ
jgi:CubicO group peptidase (beta-lactamase class C family)